MEEQESNIEADREGTEPQGAAGNGESAGEDTTLTELVDLPIVTSDAELTFEEALAVTGRRGGRLVMLMGEIGAGKTTVMVELWTSLVGNAPIGEYRCAGSRTAMALEQRSFLSRMAAGVIGAETPRTHMNEGEGLLHVRVARPDGLRVELLFADYAGERFRHVREGAPLLTELPWAPRADRVAVLIDGSLLSKGGARELAINHALRQVYALREADALYAGTSVAVIVTKNDEVSAAGFRVSKARIMHLLKEARRLDPKAKLLKVAARPADGSPAVGLDKLLEWLCADDRPGQVDPVPLPPRSRAISRLRAAL